MTGKIHTLRPEKLTHPDLPVPEVIEKLEEMLAMAKSGELRSVAIGGILTDGGWITKFHSEGEHMRVAGVISKLQFDFLDPYR